MTPESMRDGGSSSGGEPPVGDGAQRHPRPTRRGLLLGVGLAGLGGALAGCSTAAVPYDANEAGVVPGADEGVMPTSGAMSSPGAGMSSPGAGMSSPGAGMSSPGAMASSSAPAAPAPASATPTKSAKLTGTVLGAASEIPVGGGKIYTAAKVVVTHPSRGQYRAFSAVCTHVGCIMSEVANGTIDCPCHGGQFKITTGAVVAGPPPSPLPKKQIKLVNGMVVLL